MLSCSLTHGQNKRGPLGDLWISKCYESATHKQTGPLVTEIKHRSITECQCHVLVSFQHFPLFNDRFYILNSTFCDLMALMSEQVFIILLMWKHSCLDLEKPGLANQAPQNQIHYYSVPHSFEVAIVMASCHRGGRMQWWADFQALWHRHGSAQTNRMHRHGY